MLIVMSVSLSLSLSRFDDSYVTVNHFLRYNSIHVFGMKRVADGEELASCMRTTCELEGDGRRMTKSASIHRTLSQPSRGSSVDMGARHEDETVFTLQVTYTPMCPSIFELLVYVSYESFSI